MVAAEVVVAEMAGVGPDHLGRTAERPLPAAVRGGPRAVAPPDVRAGGRPAAAVVVDSCLVPPDSSASARLVWMVAGQRTASASANQVLHWCVRFSSWPS
ncbi:hypothetical protein GCM10027563_17090 [Parasphingorhabdus pacifica]